MKPANYSGGVPLISVVLACHDGDVNLLSRAVTSLRRQDMEDFEVVVAYDGPPPPKLESEMLNDAFHGVNFPVRIFFEPEKTGSQAAPRNHAIPHTHGFYIVSMDADNEVTTDHLSGLLEGIRTPVSTGQLPDFAYCRRKYVRDATVEASKKVFEGDSELVPWNQVTVTGLLKNGPHCSFIDTGDAIFPRGVLFYLAEATGSIWNTTKRRYHDYDFICRIAKCGFGGKAIDQVSNIYHWTGKNLQLTRDTSELIALPQDIYDKLVLRGLIEDIKRERK